MNSKCMGGLDKLEALKYTSLKLHLIQKAVLVCEAKYLHIPK